MKERDKHQRAFELYYAAGPARSLTHLGRRLGVAASTVKRWSTAFAWQARIDSRDRDMAEVIQTKSMSTELESRVRNKRIVAAGIFQIARQIADGKMKGTLTELDRLIRLEQFLEGRADSRQEVIARELEGKSVVELRAMVREVIEEVEELTQDQGETAVASEGVETLENASEEDECSTAVAD